MAKVQELKLAARIKVWDSDKMTPHARARVAKWMREIAEFFETPDHEFTKKFRARYWVKV